MSKITMITILSRGVGLLEISLPFVSSVSTASREQRAFALDLPHQGCPPGGPPRDQQSEGCRSLATHKERAEQCL